MELETITVKMFGCTVNDNRFLENDYHSLKKRLHQV